MKITYDRFNGIQPIRAEQLLARSQAAVARNCILHSGELRPRNNNQYITEMSTEDEAVLTIYLYLSQYWLEFTADVDIVPSPVSNDNLNRLYFTGEGLPKKTDEDEALTGAGTYPINFYPLSVPTPDFAPTAALGAGGTGTARDVAYQWTVVTSWSEEGLPSDPSNIVSALQGQTVNLSGMTLVWQAGQSYAINSWVFPTVSNGYVYRCVDAGVSDAGEPAWGTTIDSDTTDNTVEWRCYDDAILTDSGAEKRIYRVNSGATGAVWALLDTISITTTTYADSTEDDDLESTILPSEYWNPPEENLSGIVSCSGGYLAGFVGKNIYFSEPYHPHAWPYNLTVAHTIVGLASIGNSIVVLTEQNPVIYTGTHPDSLTPKVLPEPKKCVSKKSIVGTPGGILFASNSGIELIDGVSITSVLRDHFSKEEWSDFYPETMIATWHDGSYYGFYLSGGDYGGILININRGIVYTLDMNPSAVYTDPETDTLYFAYKNIDALIQEDGTNYPDREGAILLESGALLLLE